MSDEVMPHARAVCEEFDPRHDFSAATLGYGLVSDGLMRRLFDAGVRLHTLRAVLADERDPFADNTVTGSVVDVLGELDQLIRDLVEHDQATSNR